MEDSIALAAIRSLGREVKRSLVPLVDKYFKVPEGA
jgi:hypothetical protein